MNAYRSSTIAYAFRQPRYEKILYGNENRTNLKKIHSLKIFTSLQAFPDHTRIYQTDAQFWAVLGSQDCREKEIKTVISMLLLRSVFYVFMAKTKKIKL